MFIVYWNDPLGYTGGDHGSGLLSRYWRGRLGLKEQEARDQRERDPQDDPRQSIGMQDPCARNLLLQVTKSSAAENARTNARAITVAWPLPSLARLRSSVDSLARLRVPCPEALPREVLSRQRAPSPIQRHHRRVGSEPMVRVARTARRHTRTGRPPERRTRRSRSNDSPHCANNSDAYVRIPGYRPQSDDPF